MSQNEQVVGLDKSELRKALNLIPKEQYRARLLVANPGSAPGGRGSGRTTEMLLNVLETLSKGKKVAVVVPNELVGRELQEQVSRWCEMVLAYRGVRIHNLMRPIVIREWADANETVYEDNSCGFES